VLMLSSDHDDRVDPMHARKMTAALQAATTGGPVWLRIEQNAGHGGADVLAQQVDEDADTLAFLFDRLGVTAATGAAAASRRGALLLALQDLELDPAVLRPALFRLVVGDRLGLAEALGREPLGVDALVDQVGLDRGDAVVRQLHVELGAGDRVGVALDLDLGDLRVLVELAHDVVAVGGGGGAGSAAGSGLGSGGGASTIGGGGGAGAAHWNTGDDQLDTG
jgi:hypothetical protein